MSDDLDKFFDLNNYDHINIGLRLEFQNKKDKSIVMNEIKERNLHNFMLNMSPKNNIEKLLLGIYINGEKNKIEMEKIKQEIYGLQKDIKEIKEKI